MLQSLSFLDDDSLRSITLSLMEWYFSIANPECERRFVNTLVSNGMALKDSLSELPLYTSDSTENPTIV